MATKDKASVKRIVVVTPGTTIIDTDDFEALTFAFEVGTTTAVTFQDGDTPTLTDAATVAADFLIGDTSGYAAAGAALVGYVGKKRYVRMQAITNPVANTSVFAMPEELRAIGTLSDVNKSERT